MFSVNPSSDPLLLCSSRGSSWSPALKKHKLAGDTSVMTYRGHGVLHTLIRCRFSPEFSTGHKFIYCGCSTGKIISESHLGVFVCGHAFICVSEVALTGYFSSSTFFFNGDRKF